MPPAMSNLGHVSVDFSCMSISIQFRYLNRHKKKRTQKPQAPKNKIINKKIEISPNITITTEYSLPVSRED